MGLSHTLLHLSMCTGLITERHKDTAIRDLFPLFNLALRISFPPPPSLLTSLSLTPFFRFCLRLGFFFLRCNVHAVALDLHKRSFQHQVFRTKSSTYTHTCCICMMIQILFCIIFIHFIRFGESDVREHVRVPRGLCYCCCVQSLGMKSIRKTSTSVTHAIHFRCDTDKVTVRFKAFDQRNFIYIYI